MTGLPGVILFCSVAGTAAGASAPLLEAARAALDSGRCEQASGLFLATRQEGDSSCTVLLGLTRSLECMGRLEEALGATYAGTKSDTTGRIDLLAERARVLRRLGLEDLARQTEKEIGVVSPVARRQPILMWDMAPTLSGSLGWTDQFDQPHLALLPRKNTSTLSSTMVGGQVPTGQVVQSVPDSITLAGGSVQTAASLNWTAVGTDGGLWFGPSGNLALNDDSVAWRSAGTGFDVDGYWLATKLLTFQGGLSGTRTWFATETGPIPTQDEFVALLSAQWVRDAWSLSFPQTLRTFRASGDAWTWSGIHGVGVARELLPKVKFSVSGSWGWSLDPSGSVDDQIYARVVEGQGLDTGKTLYGPGVSLYTTRNGLTSQIQNTSPYLQQTSSSDLQLVPVPVSRNADWTQDGLGVGATFGPWKSVVFAFSGQWTETFYSHVQEGSQADQSYAYQYSIPVDTFNVPTVLVLRDSTTKNEYLVGDTRSNATLVPWLWKIRRRDQCWTAQAIAIWKPWNWASLRASWTWSRNISNIAEYVDGASYVRNVFSVSGSLSW